MHSRLHTLGGTLPNPALKRTATPPLSFALDPDQKEQSNICNEDVWSGIISRAILKRESVCLTPPGSAEANRVNVLLKNDREVT